MFRTFHLLERMHWRGSSGTRARNGARAGIDPTSPPLPLSPSPPLATLLLAIAILAVSSAASAAATPARYDVIAETLPKIVKLYGAGGYRGLESYGTGFLVSADGLIATSWSTLLDADPITAVLDDGRRFTAELVGVDSALGLALLKIDPGTAALPHFDLAEAAAAEPGDRILAFSNMFRVAAGDEPVSVMHGSIIARATLDARHGRYNISFDEPVYIIDTVTNNPGAAGGVIVAVDGALLGMIGRELRSTDTETWINYALTAPVLRTRLQEMIEGNEPSDSLADETMAERRPVELGLVLVPNVTTRTPAYVTDVLSDSVALNAGFEREDLILFTDGRPTRSIDDFAQQLSRAQPGDRLTIIIRRAGRLETLELQVP